MTATLTLSTDAAPPGGWRVGTTIDCPDCEIRLVKVMQINPMKLKVRAGVDQDHFACPQCKGTRVLVTVPAARKRQ